MKTKNNKIDELVSNNPDTVAITYEASTRYLIEKSNKRAWTITFISIIVTVIVLLFHIFRPLTDTQPYVIRVNDTTGIVDVLSVLDEKAIPRSEALDKYFVAQYLKAREGYFFDILQKDYELVQMMSVPDVAKRYVAEYEGENARHLVLKDNYEIDIQIVSITLENSAGSNHARVRFNQNTRTKPSGTVAEKKAKIATISYDYEPNTHKKESERLKNPLGFKVATYRIDDEILR
ncbi:MAG: type IV secretion system protein [Campylobacter sp.]|nr:type IV secretion system protein [Campylobacter sp.]